MLIDALARDLTPQQLQRTQDTIRVGLLDVVARQRSISALQRRAEGMLRRRCSTEELGPCRAELAARIRLMRTLLREQKAALKQFGDACAWLVLGSDRRVLTSLYDPAHTNDLPSGIGLVATVQVLLEAHKTGKFLVLENDLTRCLGQGDITVVWADRRSMRPMPVELKASGIPEAGEEAEVDFITTQTDVPEDRELLAEWEAALGLKTRVEPKTFHHEEQAERAERQAARMLERVQRLVRATTTHGRQIGVSGTLWRNIDNVLGRAFQAEYAIDTPQKGVVYVAWRNTLRGENVRQVNQKRFERIKAALLRYGLIQSEPNATLVTAHDLVEDANLSPVVPPIPLWEVSRSFRVALLTGDLNFMCVFGRTAWITALAEEGIELHEVDRAWVLRRDDAELAIHPLAVHVLRYGVALAAMSPRRFAAAVARSPEFSQGAIESSEA